jgi:hypothetical protein
MLHKDYDHKSSVIEEKNSGPDPQGTWRQDELTGSKQLVK